MRSKGKSPGNGGSPTSFKVAIREKALALGVRKRVGGLEGVADGIKAGVTKPAVSVVAKKIGLDDAGFGFLD